MSHYAKNINNKIEGVKQQQDLYTTWGQWWTFRRLVGSGSGFASSPLSTIVDTNAAGRGKGLLMLRLLWLLLLLLCSSQDTSVHAIAIGCVVVVNAIIYTYATVHQCRLLVAILELVHRGQHKHVIVYFTKTHATGHLQPFCR